AGAAAEELHLLLRLPEVHAERPAARRLGDRAQQRRRQRVGRVRDDRRTEPCHRRQRRDLLFGRAHDRRRIRRGKPEQFTEERRRQLAVEQRLRGGGGGGGHAHHG